MSPVCLKQYAARAKNNTSQGVWNYIAGGSEDENTLEYNRLAFSRWVLRPRVLSGCKSVDMSLSLFGQRLDSPILLAPIGYQGLIHANAELETMRGSHATQSVMVVSTMSNCSLESIAEESVVPPWFQLYCMKDKALNHSMIQRAEKAGYSALVITVDAPKLGRRERDLSMNSAKMSQLWPENFSKDILKNQSDLSFNTIVSELFEPAIDWSMVAWIKEKTRLPLILKGILTFEDAEKAVLLGVNGVIVSNHGGRQLDTAPASLDVLSEIVQAVDGRCSVLLDGGIRRGTDVLKARALGADAVLVGRPLLWGLICGGASGVAHVLQILNDELEHAMFLSGQSSWEKVDRSLIASNHTLVCRFNEVNLYG